MRNLRRLTAQKASGPEYRPLAQNTARHLRPHDGAPGPRPRSPRAAQRAAACPPPHRRRGLSDSARPPGTACVAPLRLRFSTPSRAARVIRPLPPYAPRRTTRRRWRIRATRAAAWRQLPAWHATARITTAARTRPARLRGSAPCSPTSSGATRPRFTPDNAALQHPPKGAPSARDASLPLFPSGLTGNPRPLGHTRPPRKPRKAARATGLPQGRRTRHGPPHTGREEPRVARARRYGLHSEPGHRDERQSGPLDTCPCAHLQTLWYPRRLFHAERKPGHSHQASPKLCLAKFGPV